MLSVAGLSGAGVARPRRSSSPERSSTSTPRSMLSMNSAASMLDDGDHQLVEKEPVSEGNLKILNHVHVQHEVMCCKYSEDGSMIAAGLKDGSIKIFSSESGAPLYNLADSETKEAHLPCTSINFRHHLDADKSHNVLLATYANGLVKLWHTASGQCLHTIHEPRQATLAAAFDTKTSLFVTSGSDDKIYVYDASTTQIIQTCQPSPSMNVMDGHRSRVFSIKFHPRNANEFVTGGWDDTLQFWETRKEHAIRKSYGPHICGDAIDIDLQHDHILTGSWRKTNSLQIWDYPTGSLIKTVPKDISNSLLYCAQWLGKDHIVAGGCDANMVRVIDRGTLQTTGRIVDLSRGVYCMDNNREGNIPRFAVGSSSSLLFLEMKKT
ncbi:uncharacterized protein LOC592652 isoform X2 [Strongylocentrotus purpuratus]|nr:uncharacterized protein LOC592652 isoform X2 [Strongylocentrotus purpuratus]XP_797257.3 uncharacterized protein LOC592652 isoform X2 [Strongylocentrotus purpuratus]|eukprot:XP_011664174.1 PREDICTED: dynein assembly factor with WDR repeat domains 1 isoform X2 [Strongylocentrotus purpuratus]